MIQHIWKPRCPSCNSFVSIKPWIQLLSDWVMCRCCGRKIHCPSVFDSSSIPPVRSSFQNSPSSFVAESSTDSTGQTPSVVLDGSPDSELQTFSGSALVAGSRRAETRPLVAQVGDNQNGPKGNAPLSNLRPNGKIRKIKKPLDGQAVKQLDLFGGAL